MNVVWVYIQSEPRLFTVGHYDPEGKWHAERDYADRHAAAARVHWLNGGHPAQVYDALRDAFVAIGRAGANADPHHPLRATWERLREVVAG